MTTELEHQKALNLLDNRYIRAENLTDADIYKIALEAREKNKLVDPSGNLLLAPNQGSSNSNRRPHFFKYGTHNENVQLFNLNKETEPIHNDRIESIVKSIGQMKRLSLTSKAINTTGRRFTSKNFPLNGYTWDDEVHRIVSNQKYVRHDVFGSILQNNMSINAPHIAIEVIYSHYPDERTMQEMLRISSEFPLVVIFDLVTNRTNSWAFLNISGPNLNKGIIEPSFFIFDGVLYGKELSHELGNDARKCCEQLEKWAEIHRDNDFFYSCFTKIFNSAGQSSRREWEVKVGGIDALFDSLKQYHSYEIKTPASLERFKSNMLGWVLKRFANEQNLRALEKELKSQLAKLETKKQY